MILNGEIIKCLLATVKTNLHFTTEKDLGDYMQMIPLIIILSFLRGHM